MMWPLRIRFYGTLMSLIALVCPFDVLPQSVNIGSPPFINYPKKTYQAGTQNWDAAQDSLGVMYWANNEGLLRYDGTHWSCFPVTNKTIVRSIAIDAEGKIFAGAQSELGFYSPDPTGSLHFTSLLALLPPTSRAFEDVWDIECYGQDVFFRTNRNVFQLTNGKMKVHELQGALLAMFASSQGLYLQKGPDQLFIFKNGEFELFLPIPEVKSDITGLLTWSKDTLLMATLKNGLFYLTHQQYGKWNTRHDGLLIEKRIYTATMLTNGNLALGTSLDGLIVIDRQRRISRHLNKQNGLQNNNILSTFNDRAGNVWIGLDNGIDCVFLDSPFNHIYPDGDIQSTGYAAVLHQNQLILGVSNGAYTAPWKPFYDPESGPVFHLAQNSEGQVWSLNVLHEDLLMGHHEGAFRLKNNQSEKLFDQSGSWTFLPLTEEYMLGGTYSGLVLYHASSRGWEYEQKLSGLEESCRIMVKDADGSIWISHPYRGLYHVHWSVQKKHHLEVQFYDQVNGLPSNLNNYVFQVAGRAVFGTEKGVYRFDPSNHKFIPDEEFNSLIGTDHRVKYLREDLKKNVWFISDDEVGVLLVNDFGLNKQVQKKVFPALTNKLVGGFEFMYPIDKDNIIFGTEQGFMHYAIPAVAAKDTLLQVVLSSVKASGTKDSLLFGGYAQRGGRPGLPPPTLSAGMNNIIFSFSATEYQNKEFVQYRVKLDGLESSWSDWAFETKHNYTNLNPGTYTFHVQARIKDTRESEIVEYVFRIKPPWYASKAALVIYGITFIGIFLGFLYRQRQKFESEKEMMKERHQQKEARHIQEVEQSKAVITEIQNEKLEVEIKYKNQELALTTMHLVQKAEILLSVQGALNQILDKTTNPAVKKEIQQLLNLLNFDVKLDEDWEHFAYHFDQVHADFIKNLRHQFPQLSANDYRLSAYLRMNLSTKEIAPLMNISVRGVEGSRYRLRRKLNLPNDVNLIEYFINLPPHVQQHHGESIP